MTATKVHFLPWMFTGFLPETMFLPIEIRIFAISIRKPYIQQSSGVDIFFGLSDFYAFRIQGIIRMQCIPIKSCI